MYKFNISDYIDFEKTFPNYMRSGERNRLFILNGPNGECVMMDSELRCGIQKGYDSWMFNMLSHGIITEMWK